MKRVTAVALLLLVLEFLLPMLLIHSQPVRELQEAEEAQTGEMLPIHRVTREPEYGLQDAQQTLSVQWEDGTVRIMTVADYLWGVVAAEMPASFEMEALKAQAVAARTYCVAEQTAFPAAHPLARMCTDSNCCQAYISREEAEAGWGDDDQRYARRIGQAVEQTDGLGVCYGGQAVQALYFSSAPGYTVDAAQVWSRAEPYLVSVASPEGEEVPNYYTELTLTAQQVRSLIREKYPKAKLSGSPESWFTDFERNEGGTVIAVTVGGQRLKGSEVRKLLGLRSACFTLSVTGDRMCFQTTGYGHGVGMSQYGANAMAREGKTFRDILEWYYTGAQVEALWEALEEY